MGAYEGLNFSQELRSRRTSMQLSLREASLGCGISKAMLSRFERGVGVMEMSAEKAAALADFFRWRLPDMMRKMKEQSQCKTRKFKREATCEKSK